MILFSLHFPVTFGCHRQIKKGDTTNRINITDVDENLV